MNTPSEGTFEPVTAVSGPAFDLFKPDPNEIIMDLRAELRAAWKLIDKLINRLGDNR